MARFVHLAPTNPTYHLRTLGCRVNHAEAREIESLLQDRGFEPAHSSAPADLEIVHTCAVTNQAAAKSRHAIRRAARGNGTHSPTVIVTGCSRGLRVGGMGGVKPNHPREAPWNWGGVRTQGPQKYFVGCYV